MPLPSGKSIMCAYKLCRVEFRYWGMQTKLEKFIHDVGEFLLRWFSFQFWKLAANTFVPRNSAASLHARPAIFHSIQFMVVTIKNLTANVVRMSKETGG